MSTMKIKKGDMVKVIAGKDKDKEGKVIAVDKKDGRVLVEAWQTRTVESYIRKVTLMHQTLCYFITEKQQE